MTTTPPALALAAYDAALLAAVVAAKLRDAAYEDYKEAVTAVTAACVRKHDAAAVYDAAGPLLDAARSAYYATLEPKP
jgi:hypothetical protein